MNEVRMIQEAQTSGAFALVTLGCYHAYALPGIDRGLKEMLLTRFRAFGAVAQAEELKASTRELMGVTAVGKNRQIQAFFLLQIASLALAQKAYVLAQVNALSALNSVNRFPDVFPTAEKKIILETVDSLLMATAPHLKDKPSGPLLEVLN